MSYLGIDLGTSSVKAVLIDGAGRLLASATAPLTVSRPRPGWSEQDPEAWWTATEAAVRGLGRPLSDLRGVGLSGQMHGAVCLDASGAVLRPAILWNDGRASAECAEIEAACPRSREIAGNIAMPGFTAPKLQWMRHHEPALFEQVATVLLPKDYIRLRLTGEKVGEMSDASGTLWLDVANRAWSDDLLSATGLTRDQMPSLVEGSEISGVLRADVAAAWNCARVPVAGGAGDNAAAACGTGIVLPGTAFVSLGTSGVLFVSNAAFSPNTGSAVHAFAHAIPSTWHQMGVILSAADSLEWLSRITSRPAAELAGAVHVERPSDVTFLPYLSGERTPLNDASARGSFTGLAQSHDAVDLAQAVMEGVAFAFADCQAALAEGGTDFARALAVGGGARSESWLRIIASVLDRPIDLPADAEAGAALGAARLGFCATESADPIEVCTAPHVAKTIEPDPTLVPSYAERLARYRALHPAIRDARS